MENCMTDPTDNPESPSLMVSLPLEERRRLFGLLTDNEWDVKEGEKWSDEKTLQFALEKDKRLDEMHARFKAGKTDS
jgi:hypothetical protein